MGIRSRPRTYEVVVFSGSSDGKESTCRTGDPSLIRGLGRFPGEGHGYPFQYSCLEKPGKLQSVGLQTVRHD